MGSGTELAHTADFTLKGLTRFVAPLLKPAFERLGNETEAGLRKALNQFRQGNPNSEDSFDPDR